MNGTSETVYTVRVARVALPVTQTEQEGTMMTVTQLAPPTTNDPPVSAVCARRACSFCSLTSEMCGCSNCHHRCTRCFSECRRLYTDSTCRACHVASTLHKRAAGTACVVCHGTTSAVYVDHRVSTEPLCATDHLRLWIIKTA